MKKSKSLRENWVAINNYDGLYEVSDFGNVRSVTRLVVSKNGRKVIKWGKQLAGSINSGGYHKVNLYKNSKSKTHLVHRLVAESFLCKVPGKDFVNHIDSNRINNFSANLEWVTRSENVRHSYFLGKQKQGVGERARNSKLSEKNVLDIIKMLKNKKSCLFIAKIFNVSRATIYQIKINNTWKHLSR